MSDDLNPDSLEPIALPTDEEETTPSPLPMSAHLPQKGQGLAVLIASVAFLLIALFTGWRHLAIATLSHILEPNSAFSFQEMAEGLPTPQSLNWNLRLLEVLSWLGNLKGFFLFFFGSFACAILGRALIAAVNPSFKLTGLHRMTPEKEGSSTPYALGLHGGTLSKLLRLLVWVGLPALLIVLLTTRLGRLNPLLFDSLRTIALSITFWIGFSKSGLAGDFRAAAITPPRAGLRMPFLQGLGFGVGILLLSRLLVPLPSQEYLLTRHTIHTFHRGDWSNLATPYLWSRLTVWLGVCWLAFLCSSTTRRRASLALALVAVVGIGFGIGRRSPVYAPLTRWDLTPEVLSGVRFPYSPQQPGSGLPTGREVGKALSERTNIPEAKYATRPLLVFYRRDTANVRLVQYTEDGLSIDPKYTENILAFLKKRNYETALSWAAIRHIYNAAALNFNTTKTIEACLIDLQNCPHVFQILDALRSAFFTCAASPENLALLDQFADETRFFFPDRTSLRLMGDLYLRFGQVPKALLWFKKADMPQSFMQRIEKVKPMYNKGRVQGRLLLNGKPVIGAKVGVFPHRLNGLPRYMEPMVIKSDDELIANFFFSPRFPRFHPRPFALRWISAGTVTNAKGEFTLENLTEGEYRLVCDLPENVQLEPVIDERLKVKNHPGALNLSYGMPMRNLGAIELSAPITKGSLQWQPLAKP